MNDTSTEERGRDASTKSAAVPPRNDIVQFIHQESLTNKTQSDQTILETYTCTLWKSFFDMKHKLLGVADLDCTHAVDMGLQLVDNLFWIIYHYSSNIQLTLFLTERGRLLYTEFLHMSRTHKLMKELHTYPSIHDGFQFAIKKSIGALTCQTHDATAMGFGHISRYRSMFRKMFQMINRKYPAAPADQKWADGDINAALHELNRGMTTAVQTHLEWFESCLYAPFMSECTLPEFLLVLQLVADASACEKVPQTKDASSPNSCPDTPACTITTTDAAVDTVVQFVVDHLPFVDSANLDCLQAKPCRATQMGSSKAARRGRNARVTPRPPSTALVQATP